MPLFTYIAVCIFAVLVSVILILLLYKIRLLKKRLYTDKLTGAKSPAYLDDYFDKLLVKGTYYVLVDIDQFKDLNTRLGYENADKVLQYFADLIMSDDSIFKIAARYKSGDEFLIVLPDESEKRVLEFLNRLRIRCFEMKGVELKMNFAITFSAGITTYSEGDNFSTISLRLVQGLSEAKRTKNTAIVVNH